MMRRFVSRVLGVGLLSAMLVSSGLGSLLQGQDASQIADPSQVDQAYAFQGEYAGTLNTGDGETRFGAQVIALGDGKFRAVGYRGGLPGAGWMGEEPPGEPIEGKFEDGQVVFENEMVRAVIRDGNILVNSQNGQPLGSLAKVSRQSPTLGAQPPEGAVVLFDGESVEGWQNGRMTDDGLLMQGTRSKQEFGSHRLHLEFRLPYAPQARGQARGNSGLYLQGRYEVQMLDSFGLEGKQNECGGLYSVKAPDFNMCFPPLTWQTYDVDYKAAKYDEEGKVVAPPRVTVKHNGVVIHENVVLPADRSTTAAPVKPGPEPGPIYLQDHGNPVRYRNIWVVPVQD